MEFDINRLTPPAKVEAMRYGHSALLNQEELIPFINSVAHCLEKDEHFAVTPMGHLGAGVYMYSVKVIPVVRARRVE